MLVTCPNCQTTFNIPDAAYKAGRKARCSSCSFVFPLPELPSGPVLEPDDGLFPEDTSTASTPPVPAVEEEKAPVSRATLEEDLFGELDAESASPTAEEQEAPDNAEKSFEDIIADAVETAREEPAPAQTDDGQGGAEVPDQSGDAPLGELKAPKKRRLTFIILVALLVLALGAAGVLAYTIFFKAPPETPQAELASVIANMELSDMRQYVVNNNEKIRRMVVVEGKVTNLSQGVKELVIIEASLFDKFGNTLAVQQQYCGVTLSQFMLQVLGKEEITSALSNENDILMNNTNILPGSSVPFTTVFFDPPPATYEFIVRIVDVKDAQPLGGGGGSSH
ncbi:zinc-ribbon domain-containing protein [Desulfovibrio sp. OttesenSCG-928-I05]|nr:zinc-ribbon domain-containing protein [Desulfovibrio sp. OttesenSCG-928-I05]